jgi:hypothetical protein
MQIQIIRTAENRFSGENSLECITKLGIENTINDWIEG